MLTRISQINYHLVLGVEAMMDDFIHVKVEVVVDDAIGPLLAATNGRCRWFVFFLLPSGGGGGGDDVWVLFHEPTVETTHSHGSS